MKCLNCSHEIDKSNKWLSHLSDAVSYVIDSIMPIRIKSSNIQTMLNMNVHKDPFSGMI